MEYEFFFPIRIQQAMFSPFLVENQLRSYKIHWDLYFLLWSNLCLWPALELGVAWMLNSHENSQHPSLDKSQLWSLDVAPNFPIVWDRAKVGMQFELITHSN